MTLRSTCALALGLALALPGVAAAAEASPVADAAKQQDVAAIRTLVQKRVDVNTPQPDGATALHWAAHWDDAEAVGLLISAGAAVNARNDYDVTPLALAAQNASLAVVERLVAAGADVNAASSTGETPLMTAVRAGSLPVVQALIAAGADVNVKGGGREQTALHWATAQGRHEIMQALIDAKADLNARTELRPEFVSFSRGNPQGGRLTGIADHTLESNGSRPGLRWINKGGLTALLFAARDGDLAAVKLLTAAGADLDATTGIGETALMLAAHHDHTDVALYLLDQGADPNVVEAGHTALHFAVARKNLDLVKALIAHKAEVNVRLTKGQPDPDGNLRYNQLPEYLLGATPYLLATALNETETMKVLAAAGADPRTPMEDGTTPTMASMGVFPGVFTFIPFVTIGEKGAQGDNTAYFQRKRLFSEDKVLETMKLAVELSGGEDINAARGALVTYHVGNSRNLVGRGVGDTALHIASADKYPTVIEFLISKGARTDIKNRRGLTPLALAKSPDRQFITGGNNGEKIGDEKIATLLASLGAQE